MMMTMTNFTSGQVLSVKSQLLSPSFWPPRQGLDRVERNRKQEAGSFQELFELVISGKCMHSRYIHKTPGIKNSCKVARSCATPRSRWPRFETSMQAFKLMLVWNSYHPLSEFNLLRPRLAGPSWIVGRFTQVNFSRLALCLRRSARRGLDTTFDWNMKIFDGNWKSFPTEQIGAMENHHQ